jgi:hypothetical protein
MTMKVTTITVDAGRTFNHPYESYSNLRPSVTMTASLDEGDNPDECAKALQARAEELIENHKQHLLSSLERLHELSIIERETNSLEQNIRTNQNRLTHLRERSQAYLEQDQRGDSEPHEL